MFEDNFILKYFKDFAAKTAFSLTDDGASLPSLEIGYEWAISSDSIASDVHLPADTNMALIAKHLLLTNLSDIAAMGAKPKYVMLNIGMTPKAEAETRQEFAEFAAGTIETLQEYGLKILGGDIISLQNSSHNPNAWVFSATLVGVRKISERKFRGDARAGDILAVTGNLGDAMLGLTLLQNPNLVNKIVQTDADFLRNRYYLPTPRFLGQCEVLPYINGLMDISDGVIQDGLRMAKASGLGLELDLDLLPQSVAAKNMLKKYPEYNEKRIIGGGDYELLMSVDRQDFSKLQNALSPLALTKIGELYADKDMGDITYHGKNFMSNSVNLGFTHFE